MKGLRAELISYENGQTETELQSFKHSQNLYSNYI